MIRRTGSSAFDRDNVRAWMRLNVEHADTATTLAEIAAMEFGQDSLRGPLDDESHWIWEIALEVFDAQPSAPARLFRTADELEREDPAAYAATFGGEQLRNLFPSDCPDVSR